VRLEVVVFGANKYLSDKESEYLESLLWKNIQPELRNCLMLLLLLKTGARSGELLALEKRHVNTQYKSIYITGAKGSNDREIPLEHKLFTQLMKYCKDMKDDELLFNLSYERLYQVWSMYRPVKKGLHSLRHSAAINLYKKCKDIRLVQRFLGHKSITSSEVYQQYVYTQSELRKVLCE
jgi:integrase/recombinase XerC